MNTCFSMASSWFYVSISFCFSFLALTAICGAYGASYIDNCSSIVPESIATSFTHNISLPYLHLSYFTGGDKLLVKNLSNQNQSYYYVRKSLRFPIKPYFYETKTEGIYKVEAWLYIQSPYRHYNVARTNYSNGRSSSPRFRRNRWSSSVRSLLSGFWSEKSRKLCMVGSATWQYDEADAMNLDVVLKLNYAGEAPTIHASIISGTFESASSTDDLGYFDPISIFDFPALPNYEYSLITKELDGGFSRYSKVPKNQSLSLQSSGFCSITLSSGLSLFELWYATECKTTPNCSLLGGDGKLLPRFMLLNPIQCSEIDKKIRYRITFQNTSYRELYADDFSLDSTLIGEASWDDSNNQLFIAACRILDPENHFGHAVADCAIRVSLRYPSIWNIRSVAKIVGQVWTNKTSEDSKYFRKIELRSVNGNGAAVSQQLRYEYTEMDRVQELCATKMLVKKGKYPDAQSYDMRFDMSVKNSKGKKFAWGGATPLSVGNELYQGNYAHTVVHSDQTKSSSSDVAMSEPEINTRAPSNISYKITVNPFPEVTVNKWFQTMNWSMNSHGQLEITAEGVYDPETGHLCMVGCRGLLPNRLKTTNDSRDCEILLNFQFALLTNRKGSLIKGTIKSTRKKADPLHFDDLSLSSIAYYSSVAKRSIWRVDIEITMVLISNTLLCIFIGLQLLHLRRNPEVFSGISLAMLQILSLGHLIPLVLNFEAVFLDTRDKQRLWVSAWGWLEANEVAIRVITMVAFLLQIRLLQLVWTRKASKENKDRGSRIAERKTFFTLLPMYIAGALLTLILNQFRASHGHQQFHNYSYSTHPSYSLWKRLRSYAVLILDGFLLPQVVLNTFRGSAEKTLCSPFYIGITLVRLAPHAYDLYRANNYPAVYIRGAYYYANPTADFYSKAWDIIIPCGIIALAAIILLQQRYGGRCFLPERFREVELYEKVPAVDS